MHEMRTCNVWETSAGTRSSVDRAATQAMPTLSRTSHPTPGIGMTSRTITIAVSKQKPAAMKKILKAQRRVTFASVDLTLVQAETNKAYHISAM